MIQIHKVRLAVYRSTRGFDSGYVYAHVDGYRVRFNPTGWSCSCAADDTCDHIAQLAVLIDPRTLEAIELGKREGQATNHRRQRIAEDWTAKIDARVQASKTTRQP